MLYVCLRLFLSVLVCLRLFLSVSVCLSLSSSFCLCLSVFVCFFMSLSFASTLSGPCCTGSGTSPGRIRGLLNLSLDKGGSKGDGGRSADGSLVWFSFICISRRSLCLNIILKMPKRRNENTMIQTMTSKGALFSWNRVKQTQPTRETAKPEITTTR